MRILQWRKLPINLAELCLDTTLRCGQSFRYARIALINIVFLTEQTLI